MNDKFDMIFADEDSGDYFKSYYGYKILVVDDEKDIHDVTHLAFENITFEGEYLQLVDAYSANEARKILRKNSDIAMILLDVVMESDVAGLELVNYIREELKDNAMCIVLRTGYPGKAPEKEVIKNYDINDYRIKTELTSDKIFSLVTTGLRTHKTINTLQTKADNLKCEVMELKLAGNINGQAGSALKTAVNTMPELMSVFDKEHRINRVNRALAFQLGLFTDEVEVITGCGYSYKKKGILDIHEIVSETVKSFGSFLPKTIEICQNRCITNSSILGDTLQIKQLVLYLCSNAYHAMREEGGRLDVSLEPIRLSSDDHLIKAGFEPKEYIRLSVSDTGLGMDDDTTQKIHDPCFTARRHANDTASGELSAVCRIVKNHNGHITVSSEKEAGTTFQVYLPVFTTQNQAEV